MLPAPVGTREHGLRWAQLPEASRQVAAVVEGAAFFIITKKKKRLGIQTHVRAWSWEHRTLGGEDSLAPCLGSDFSVGDFIVHQDPEGDGISLCYAINFVQPERLLWGQR